jgi:Alternative oxidase
VFTDDEIVEIGDLFYAGKSGGSVSFDKFVEAIDRVVQRETKQTTASNKSPYDRDHDTDNPLGIGSCGNEFLFYKAHGTRTEQDLHISMTHTPPQNLRDRLALQAVKVVRFFFDTATGWNQGDLTKSKILHRVIYLETIAAVPGMVAAIVRHFKSLRTMTRDGGMMQMFLDEANNERMHLLTFVKMQNPSTLFRAAVICGQFGFGSLFLAAYIVAPKFCHRFVGYIEEEACSTYTKIIDKIEKAPDSHELAAWRTEIAPGIARAYWKLGETGSVLDVMYAVRADEAEHRDVNHICTELKDGDPNPVANTEEKLNTMLSKYVHEIMNTTSQQENRSSVAK